MCVYVKLFFVVVVWGLLGGNVPVQGHLSPNNGVIKRLVRIIKAYEESR